MFFLVRSSLVRFARLLNGDHIVAQTPQFLDHGERATNAS